MRNRITQACEWRRAPAGALAVALGAATLFAQFGGSIEGQIRTADNQPLPPNVTVRLEAAEGAYLNQIYVGSDGRFTFTNLGAGMYRLVVTAEGYKTVSQTVDMAWWASRTPTVYLVPVVKKTVTEDGSPTVAASDLSAPKKAREELEKGLRDLSRGKLDPARKHLEKAVALHECYVRAQTALGAALGMSGEFDAAEAAFAQALACDPGFVEAYVERAVLLNARKKYAECEAAIQAGLGKFPNEWRLHFQLGIARDGAGDYRGAEESLLKAQLIHPEVPPEFHLRLADVYLNLRRYPQAHAELAKYVAAAPEGAYAEPSRKIMQQLEWSGLVSPSRANAEAKKP